MRTGHAHIRKNHNVQEIYFEMDYLPIMPCTQLVVQGCIAFGRMHSMSRGTCGRPFRS